MHKTAVELSPPTQTCNSLAAPVTLSACTVTTNACVRNTTTGQTDPDIFPPYISTTEEKASIYEAAAAPIQFRRLEDTGEDSKTIHRSGLRRMAP